MPEKNNRKFRINEKWFAIRITYSRELALKKHLDLRKVKNFLPMKQEIRVIGARKFRKLVPAVHNLIFIYSNRKLLNTLKQELEYMFPIRYIMDRETRHPIVIPEKQMRDFIAVAGTYNEQLMWLDSTPGSYKKGDTVRITGGIFAGVEGKLLDIKGDRRVVVSIPGFMAVATAIIHPSLLEKA